MTRDSPILEDIKRTFASSMESAWTVDGDAWLRVSRTAYFSVASFLKKEREFELLLDLTAVDYLGWPEKKDRFEVQALCFSLRRNQRVFLKVAVPENDPVVDSLTPLWTAADWYEREVWDMFGIRFRGHPNLRRILLYEEFKGHPLRKDYPYNLRQPLIGPKN